MSPSLVRRAADHGEALPRALQMFARPLAADEHRAAFFVRHVVLGVALSQIAGALVVVYVQSADRPQATSLTVLALLMMLSTPLLLRLPMQRWCRDGRGTLVLYGWSALSTLLLGASAVIDGGAGSPLLLLLTFTLTYAGLAYPPAGVGLIGGLTVVAYLAVATLAPDPEAETALPLGVLVVFTLMNMWSSLNLRDMVDRQHSLTTRLSRLADTDELTSCLNRRAFQHRLNVELGLAGPDTPVSLCVLDLDGFKQVNDTGGHAAGDRILVSVASGLLAVCRSTDIISRLGGDEFAVLLPNTSAEAAAVAGQRLLEQIESAAGSHAHGAGISASVGIATTSAGMTADAFLAAADTLMYEAKVRGGNQARTGAARQPLV